MDGDESAVGMSADTEVEDVAVSTPETALESQEPAPESDSVAQGSVWDAFKQLPQFQGQQDADIAAALYQSMQREQSASRALAQYQQVIPLASEYMTNRELFEQWKASQQQAQQPQAPAQQAPQQQEEPWWNPPKLRDAYKQYLGRDENGREVISPDAPLDAKHALAEYQAYRANFAQKFLEDPQSALGPMVERLAEEKARSIVEDRFGRFQEESFVQEVEAKNKDWLYDENGRASPEALRAQKYIQEAKDRGIQGAKSRWEYAERMVERDLLLLHYQATQQQGFQNPAPPPAAPATPPAPAPADDAAKRNMEYLRQQAMRTASRGSPATTDPRVPQRPMTFAEKLRQQLSDEGMLNP